MKRLFIVALFLVSSMSFANDVFLLAPNELVSTKDLKSVLEERASSSNLQIVVMGPQNVLSEPLRNEIKRLSPLYHTYVWDDQNGSRAFTDLQYELRSSIKPILLVVTAFILNYRLTEEIDPDPYSPAPFYTHLLDDPVFQNLLSEGKAAARWISFRSFIKWCRDHDVKSRVDHMNRHRKEGWPDSVPFHANLVYGRTWPRLFRIVRDSSRFMSLQDLTLWLQDQNIQTAAEYRRAYSGVNRPPNLPFDFERHYQLSLSTIIDLAWSETAPPLECKEMFQSSEP